jgi:CheY-like chemotaxis protein
MGKTVRQRILVVDDDELTLVVLGLVLKHFGFEVLKAGSGSVAEAVVAADGASLALVILDMKMPVMDGEQTFAVLRKLQPDLPFLLYSGHGSGEAVARLLQSSCCAFLPKTFSMEELQRAILDLLEQHPRKTHG